MASVMTLSFTACGSKPAEADNPAEESTENGGESNDPYKTAGDANDPYKNAGNDPYKDAGNDPYKNDPYKNAGNDPYKNAEGGDSDSKSGAEVKRESYIPEPGADAKYTVTVTDDEISAAILALIEQHKMVAEGVATRSDALSVDVRLNAAQVDLTKVQNGVVLSRMALAQVCGLPVDAQFTLADEDAGMPEPEPAETDAEIDMQTVYATRPDLRALSEGIEVARQQTNVAKASMMPQLALVGAWQFSNPNAYDGFNKRFKGAFSVGAMLTVPLWHWGGNYNKYRAANCDRIAMELKLEDARELVVLQVRQATFKNKEAVKTYNMTLTNLAKADENLRTADIAFKEGVATTDIVMAAQTAWLKAHSENIDAAIDVKLCRVYLSKVLGTLYK